MDGIIDGFSAAQICQLLVSLNNVGAWDDFADLMSDDDDSLASSRFRQTSIGMLTVINLFWLGLDMV